MKYVKSISEPIESTLIEAMRNISNYRARMRAHAILLSSRGFKIKEICKIYEVDRDTVSIWFDKWEQYGIVSIFDSYRSGRKKILTKEEERIVLDEIKVNPRNLKAVASEVKRITNKSLSVKTIKRIAKSAGLLWKRVRKSVKRKPDPDLFKMAKTDINQLLKQEEDGIVNVLFFDEAGFALEPVVPYAWQPLGETIRVPSSKSNRLNVLGFLSKDSNLTSYVFEGTITSNEVVACFDAIAKKGLEKPTWIVIDNAPIHTSSIFKNKISEWESKNLFIKHIPAYSPELNIIEILWKQIKYFWLPFSAYTSFEALKNSLDGVLKNVGKKHLITFV